MAVDITVYPNFSPRIIVVDYPQTEVTIQELIDAIRDWEDSDIGMSYPYLIDAAGKEDLGGGVTVGLTATLQNAQVRFAARPTPLSTGTITTADSEGKKLIDSTADFVTDGIYSGCTFFNNTTTAMETVIVVDSKTQLTGFPLQSGTRQDWQVGDNYSVYPNTLCKITGGNLVAVDNIGNPIDAVLPSPNVLLNSTSSSSATLQELSAIQYSSFGGGVTVDVINGTSGTAFPIGTIETPVNNLTDAMIIANSRGFDKIYINGDLTIDTSGNYAGMVFVGESMTKSTLTISSGANVTNCEFYEATITGTLDGNSKLKNCKILDLDYIYGVIEECMLGPGTITLGGNEEAHFLDCWSGVAGLGTPIIDCGGSGQDLALRNYNGGIKIINKTGSDKISIDLNSGDVILDSTVTNGNIIIRGIGTLTDNSGAGATVTVSALINNETIADQVWDETASDHETIGSTGKKLKDARDDAEISAVK